jgi:hypothetical protein
MQGLRNRDIFRFCAIPQIMSIGTLSQLYNNGKVFQGAWWAAGADTLQPAVGSSPPMLQSHQDPVDCLVLLHWLTLHWAVIGLLQPGL